MDASLRMGRTGIFGAAAMVITVWALLGGVVLLAVMLVNVISVLGGIFWKPFTGDFELTEMGVAVAAFAFLPYCQMTGANVTADIFTARASRRWVAGFTLLASIVALLFALLMMWRMELGMVDKQTYGYTTALLQIPIWYGFVPAIVSMALLAIAALMTLVENARDIVRPSRDV